MAKKSIVELLVYRASFEANISAMKMMANRMAGKVKSLRSSLWLPSPNVVAVGIAYRGVLLNIIG